MPQNNIEGQLADLRGKLGKAKEKLAIAKANRDRLQKELRPLKVATVEQAKDKMLVLKGDVEKLEKEAGVLLDRASKLLERFE